MTHTWLRAMRAMCSRTTWLDGWMCSSTAIEKTTSTLSSPRRGSTSSAGPWWSVASLCSSGKLRASSASASLLISTPDSELKPLPCSALRLPPALQPTSSTLFPGWTSGDQKASIASTTVVDFPA